MKISKSSLSVIITVIVIAVAFSVGFSTNPDADKVSTVDYSNTTKNAKERGWLFHKTETTEVPKVKQIKKVSDKMRNKFYGESAFIGNSIGLGQKAYFENQGAGFLGDPLMLVTGSYSFNNDTGVNGATYMLSLNGSPMRAKEAVAQSGVPRVFIFMGTNDCFGDANYVFEHYVDYVEGIKQESPDVVIFIESTTGVTAANQGTYLNSKTIRELNEKMKAYCDEHKDMYFVDIGSKLLDANGYLKSEYSTDNYVHLNMSAFEIWTNELIAYTDALQIKEYNAKSAVKVAKETNSPAVIEKAKKLVDELDDSTVKDELKKTLKSLEGD